MKAEFEAAFVNKEFDSFDAFEAVLKDFMMRHNVCFLRASSMRSRIRKLRYQKVTYHCLYHTPRKSQSKGLRRVNSRSTGCPSRFTLARYRQTLRVSAFHIEHNHPLDECNTRFPWNRQLTDSELLQLEDLVRVDTPTAHMREFIANSFGKNLTASAVQYIRLRIQKQLFCTVCFFTLFTLILLASQVSGIPVTDDGTVNANSYPNEQVMMEDVTASSLVDEEGNEDDEEERKKVYVWLHRAGCSETNPELQNSS